MPPICLVIYFPPGAPPMLWHPGLQDMLIEDADGFPSALAYCRAAQPCNPAGAPVIIRIRVGMLVISASNCPCLSRKPLVVDDYPYGDQRSKHSI